MKEKVKLGECATFINGYAFKPTDWSRNGIPIIRIQNLTGSMKQLNYYNGKLDSKYIINNGDILISWSASLGIFEWKKGKAYLNQHIFKVEFNKKDINKKYFVYLIKSKINEMKKNTHGATMKHITKSDFNKIEIFLPNIQKQQEISNKLDKVQEIIDLRKKQIEELDNLIKAQFVEMFQSKNYPKEELGNLCDVRDGTHDSPKYIEESKYKFITSKNIINNEIDFSEVKYISKQDYDKFNTRSRVNCGDILMPMIGTIGKPMIVNIPDDKIDFAIKNVALIKILNYSQVTNIYIKNLLDSDYFENAILQNKRGGTQKFIALSDIRKIQIEIPPIELQNQFAEIVNQINNQKFILEKSLKETEELQSSLMNKYFE